MGTSPVQERRRSAIDVPRWKRALDLLFLLASLPVTLPLAGLIALYVKASSSGPVMFRQERVGYCGRLFMCLKFRTMKVGADHSTHRDHLNLLITSEKPMTKLDQHGDDRLIPFGGWLRASGLDELPQLINIWRGEMSMVGPRPCLPYEYAKYSEPQKLRFSTAPGLTGLWQVSGKNRTTFKEMIQMDTWYANHKTLWLDLKIIALTIPTLLAQLMEARGNGRSVALARGKQST